jgi:hypothetical protein
MNSIKIKIGSDAVRLFSPHTEGSSDPLRAMLERRGRRPGSVELRISKNELARFESTCKNILFHSECTDELRAATHYLEVIQGV